jgi:hypothetical protein
MRKKMVAILALSLLLVACDRALPDNKSGKEVTVRVRLVGIAEGDEEDLNRSASLKEPEKIVTSIGDGMLMETQMERDTSALRANKTQLATTSIFRVIAFKHNTKTFISYDDFTGDGTPVAGSLHVPINDCYDFVCYSYNTDTPLDALDYKQNATIPDTKTIDVLQGENDLLWTKIKVDVTDVAPDLEILLSRVMARVKVVIDLSYNKWTIMNIGNITLTTVNSGGTIQLIDGAVASNMGTPIFSSWTGTGYQQESTTELLVMPKAIGSTITVSIPREAVARQDLSPIPTNIATSTFTAELKSGYSYRILVRLRSAIFARSNIYWDNATQKLTFVPAAIPSATDNDTKTGYQGVFFKWGSLVGISPVQTEVPESSGTMTNDFLPSTPIYVPLVKSTLSASTWVSTTGSATGSINDIDASVRYKYTLWSDNVYTVNEGDGTSDIPYVEPDRGGTSTSRTNTYLIDPDWNNFDAYKGLRGDICQYLGATNSALAGYRLPTSAESGHNDSQNWTRSDGWVPAADISARTTSAADGTGNIIGSAAPPDQSFAKNTIMNDVIFPASGWRQKGSNGALIGVGTFGYYWNGSVKGSTFGFGLIFGELAMMPYAGIERSCACAVRCVLD